MNIEKKRKMKVYLSLISVIIVIALASQVYAAGYTNSSLGLDLAREQRLAFDHVIYISDISTTPANVAPGSVFTLNFKITNEGTQFVRDIITKISLPEKISPYKDVTSNKLPVLNIDQSADLSFSLIVSPDAESGLYRIPVIVNYVNYIGDERQENETLTVIVSSVPELFAEVKTADIYQGQESGKITVTIANNDLANIKFLTVELKDSPDYEILNSRKIYVGDLDSDDTQSIDFKIKVNKGLTQVNIPLILTYKDPINNDYSQEIAPTLYVRTAEDLGIKSNKGTMTIIAVIILLLVAYFIYRRYQKNKKKPLMFK